VAIHAEVEVIVGCMDSLNWLYFAFAFDIECAVGWNSIV